MDTQDRGRPPHRYEIRTEWEGEEPVVTYGGAENAAIGLGYSLPHFRRLLGALPENGKVLFRTIEWRGQSCTVWVRRIA